MSVPQAPWGGTGDWRVVPVLPVTRAWESWRGASGLEVQVHHSCLGSCHLLVAPLGCVLIALPLWPQLQGVFLPVLPSCSWPAHLLVSSIISPLMTYIFECTKSRGIPRPFFFLTWHCLFQSSEDNLDISARVEDKREKHKCQRGET